MRSFEWPLMEENITRADLDAVIDFLRTTPRLTQATQVAAFEREWSEWLGVPYSVFVNSGASANFITLGVLRHLHGPGEVIVPPLTWISDIASVLHWGFTPVFADIDPRTLCLDSEQVIERLGEETRAVFLTHVQGFCGLDERLLAALDREGVFLLEDACEAHGATFRGRRVGTFGLASNFSFYYAHHMSTVEGGMISTSDEAFYEAARMFRSHGMVREAKAPAVRERYAREHPDLDPAFIFAYPGFNMRNTVLGAVLGRRQLGRLDARIEARNHNLRLFLGRLDPDRYRTGFELEGCSNYALDLVLREPDEALRGRVEETLRERGVEFRRGSSGGGNQLRQPYLRDVIQEREWERFPETEHIHFFGYYLGNYPELERHKILGLCEALNRL